MLADLSSFNDEDVPEEEDESEDWEDEDNPDSYARPEPHERPDASSEADEDQDDTLDEQAALAPHAESLDAFAAAVRARRGLGDLPEAQRVLTRAAVEEAVSLLHYSGVAFRFVRDKEFNASFLFVQFPQVGPSGATLLQAVELALKAKRILVLRKTIREGRDRHAWRYDVSCRLGAARGMTVTRSAVAEALGRSALRAADNHPSNPDSDVRVSRLEARIVELLAEVRETRALDAEARSAILYVQHSEDRRIIAYRRRLDEQVAYSRRLLHMLRISSATSDAGLRQAHSEIQRIRLDFDVAEDLLLKEADRVQSLSSENDG